MELARIHSQLQVSSDRASHFLDAETCEFCASSIAVHGMGARGTWDINVGPTLN